MIAAAVVLGVVLYLARSALTPFLIGLVLVYVLDPAVTWLAGREFRGRRLPRALAVLLVYAVVLSVLVEAIAILIGPLVAQILEYVRDLPRFSQALEDASRRLSEIYRGLELPPGLRESIDRALSDIGGGGGGFDIGTIFPLARGVVGALAALFAYLIVPVWMFYILKDRPRLLEGLARALPPTWRGDVWALLGITERVFGRWLRGQLLLGLIVGLATGAGLALLGLLVDPRFLQFAVLLAVIAGVFELLPIIGPILSMIPTILVGLTAANPLQGVVAVVILYLIVQQLENNVLVPKVQGDAVELHPSLVIFALIVGGSIAGLVGAIFALPVTAAARDVYRYLFRRLSEDDPAIPAADEVVFPRPPLIVGQAVLEGDASDQVAQVQVARGDHERERDRREAVGQEAAEGQRVSRAHGE